MNNAGTREMFQLKMFTEFGIVAYRLQKDGQLAWIKHATLGWMNPAKFLLLRRIENLPWREIVEGGYRINQALYSAEVEVEVLATGAQVPLGAAIVTSTVGAILFATATGDLKTAALLGAALTLPFGALLLCYLFFSGLFEAGQDLSNLLGAIGNPIDFLNKLLIKFSNPQLAP